MRIQKSISGWNGNYLVINNPAEIQEGIFILAETSASTARLTDSIFKNSEISSVYI